MEKVIAIEQTEIDRDPKEVPKEYHVVIATIEGATEMILVEIEIGMTTDMIQDTMIEKNIEEMKIEIIIGNPIDREIVVDQGTVVNGDALIVVEIVAIHANTTDIVENEIEVLIKEGDSPLHQDIMIAMIAKIMGIEDTHLMKGKFLRFTWYRFRYPSHIFLVVNIEMIEIVMTTVDTIVVVLGHHPILVMTSHILNVQLLTDDLKMTPGGQIMQ